MKMPLVAIVGRANVGKSTLFNKLVGHRKAIVNDQRGVTRDRNYGVAECFGKRFLVVDTGGVEVDGENDLEPLVAEQAEVAINEADSILFLADNIQGLTPHDKEVILSLRHSGKPLYVAVNKVDHKKAEIGIYEFSEIGLDDIYPISAEHGIGIGDLMESIVDGFPEGEENEFPENEIRVAIIGRPNVGKSSLINALLNSQRCIVSDVPGTTRDAVDSRLEYEGVTYVLVDTAGIRRKGKTVHTLEKFSVIMTLKAIERCDVAVLILDASEGVTDQDATIAGYAYEAGRGCLVAVNKWDLAKNKKMNFKEFYDLFRKKLKFLDFAPVFAVSAKTGYNLTDFFRNSLEVFNEYTRNIQTSVLNECFERAIQKNPMSQFRGKFLKMYYSTQIRSRPPTFRCFVNYPDGIHFSYRRYLTNSLRKTFGLSGVPVRLIFSRRSE